MHKFRNRWEAIRDVEAETVEEANFRRSGSGRKALLPLWPFTSNVKKLECGTIFCKMYDKKVNAKL